MTLTVHEVAVLEAISDRQVQRYIAAGYQGHKLPAVRLGKAFVIAEDDYRAWRIACGFDATPAPASPGDAHPASASPGDDHPAPGSPGEPRPSYPPYPLSADPRGVPTNAPHEHSCNWPHPLAFAEYTRSEAERVIEKYRGNPDDIEG